MSARFRYTVALGLMVALWGGVASAADEAVDAQLFRPSIFPGRFLSMEDSSTRPAWCPAFGLYANFADSLVEQRIDDEFDSGVLESLTTLNLTAALGLWRWMSVGVDVPYHARARGKSLDDIETLTAEGAEQTNLSALGDVRAALKLGVLRQENAGIGLGLTGFVSFPTGDPDHLLGDGSGTAGGRLIVERDFGFINAAVNGGYRYRGFREVLGIEVGPNAFWGAGLSRDFQSGLGFSLEYAGNSFAKGDNTTNDDIRTDPMEFLLTMRWRFGAWRAIGGGGGGIGGGLGSPSYRVVAGFDYAPDCAPPPPEPPPAVGRLRVTVRDDAGVPVSANLTVLGPQAFDVTSDADGLYIADLRVGAYHVAASREGFESAAGEAEVIEAGESAIDLVLKRIPPPLPLLTVRVIFDKTKELIPAASITVIAAAGGDKASHSLPDGTWSGEVQPGTYKVVATAAGFSIEEGSVDLSDGVSRTLTVVVYKKIILLGTVHFFFSSPRIRDISNPVLQDALEKIRAEQEAGGLKRVRIEGHTSSEGWIVYNQKLSQRRAEAVKAWLVARGVEADLLEPVGFGPEKPIAGNNTEPERQLNRRVEFVLQYE